MKTIKIRVTGEELAAIGLHFRGMLRAGIVQGEFSALNRVLWKVARGKGEPRKTRNTRKGK